MIVLAGLLALLFHFLLAGLFWPNRHDYGFGITLWSLFVKSIYVSWFLFVFSFYTNSGAVAFWVVVLGVCSVFVNRVTKRWNILLNERTSFSVDSWVTLLGLGIAALLLSYILPEIGKIFSLWDPVVSWNRWALEFTHNLYNPVGAAYPVLLPALWSLVYEAQGTNAVWVISKASLVLFPCFLVALMLGQRTSTAPWVGVIGLVLFSFTLVQPSDFEYLVSGHADWPVALLGCGSMLLSVHACVAYGERDEKVIEILIIALITAGLAAITKQPGALFLVLGLILAIWIGVFSNRSDRIRLIGGALLALVPVASFLVMYSLATNDAFLGNLPQLQNLSESQRGTSRIWSAATLAFGQIPAWGICVLVVGFLLNLIRWRSLQAGFSAILFCFALIGFLIFADCCSYDRRNAIWLFGLVVPCSYSGYHILGAWLRATIAIGDSGRKRLSRIPLSDFQFVFALVIFLIGILATQFPNEKLRSHQESLQRMIGSQEFNEFVYQAADKMKDADSIVTYYQLLVFLPGFEDVTKICLSNDRACIERQVIRQEGQHFLIYHRGITKGETRKWLDEMLLSGELELIAQSPKFRIVSKSGEYSAGGFPE